MICTETRIVQTDQTSREHLQAALQRLRERMSIIDATVADIIDRPDAMIIAVGIAETLAIQRHGETDRARCHAIMTTAWRILDADQPTRREVTL